MFPLRVGKKKMPKEEAKKKAYEYIKMTKIENIVHKKPSKLSGGQQQSVAIAAALVQEPKILLLDEPLNNLDAKLRTKIREEIRVLVKSMNITTIFVTHDQEEALAISDKITLMHNGVIVQTDDPQHLYINPSSLYVAKFLGNPSINLFIMGKQHNKLISEDFVIDLRSLDGSKLSPDLYDEDFFVGIRPENFVLVDPQDSLFTTVVAHKEVVARDCVLHFKINNIVSKIIVDSHTLVAKGDKIYVGIDYDNIHIFTIDGVRVY